MASNLRELTCQQKHFQLSWFHCHRNLHWKNTLHHLLNVSHPSQFLEINPLECFFLSSSDDLVTYISNQSGISGASSQLFPFDIFLLPVVSKEKKLNVANPQWHNIVGRVHPSKTSYFVTVQFSIKQNKEEIYSRKYEWCKSRKKNKTK